MTPEGPIRSTQGEPFPDAPAREAEEASVGAPPESLNDPHTPPPPPASADPRPTEEKPVGELFLEVTEQATVLIREEVELAKAEISDKLNRLLAGSVMGVVAGVFLLAALILIMHGLAIVLGENVFDGRVWLGYLVEAVAFLLIAAGSGFYAYRSIRKATPPVPEMAIEQAKEIRASLDLSEPPK